MLFNASNDHITTSFLPTCLCLIHHYNNSIHLNSCRLNFFANSIHVFLNNGKDCSWMQNILCVKECDVKSNKYQIYHFPIPQIFHFFRLLCQYCSHCIMWIWDNFFGFPKWNWKVRINFSCIMFYIRSQKYLILLFIWNLNLEFKRWQLFSYKKIWIVEAIFPWGFLQMTFKFIPSRWLNFVFNVMSSF